MLDREKGTAAVAVRLPKVLSIWDTTAYMICSVVGAGIFIAPKGVLVYTGSPFMALVVWLMTGKEMAMRPPTQNVRC